MFSKSSHRLLYVLKVTKYRERMENVNEKVYEMCVCMDMLLNMRVCVCVYGCGLFPEIA